MLWKYPFKCLFMSLSEGWFFLQLFLIPTRVTTHLLHDFKQQFQLCRFYLRKSLFHLGFLTRSSTVLCEGNALSCSSSMPHILTLRFPFLRRTCSNMSTDKLQGRLQHPPCPLLAWEPKTPTADGSSRVLWSKFFPPKLPFTWPAATRNKPSFVSSSSLDFSNCRLWALTPLGEEVTPNSVPASQGQTGQGCNWRDLLSPVSWFLCVNVTFNQHVRGPNQPPITD